MDPYSIIARKARPRSKERVSNHETAAEAKWNDIDWDSDPQMEKFKDPLYYVADPAPRLVSSLTLHRCYFRCSTSRGHAPQA